MKRLKRFVRSLLDKNLLWWSGLAMTALGFYGIGSGVYCAYNGIILPAHETYALMALLEKLSMTPQDGMYALVGIGTALIVLYLFFIGAGLLGMLSAGRRLRQQSLFWYVVVLMAAVVIFALAGVISWGFAALNLLCCAAYAAGVYTKFNQDLKYVQRPSAH